MNVKSSKSFDVHFNPTLEALMMRRKVYPVIMPGKLLQMIKPQSRILLEHASRLNERAVRLHL
jgi:hypothetical protein